jgi:dUTP pyrophosphatase
MELRIKRIDPSLPLPAYHSEGAAAFDLYSRLDMTIAPGTLARIPANLIVETPPEHALIVALRSSTPKRKGLSHPAGIGVVDSDYRGPEDEVMVQVFNFTADPVTVERGERIAQAFISATPRLTFVETEQLDAPSRGGFGSTGI